MLRHLLLLLLLLPATTYSLNKLLLTDCSGGNYTSPSPYETNLRALLFNLSVSAAKSQTLFATTVAGDPSSPSEAFGLAQCRPDITVPNCTACIRRVATTALTYPSDGCPLRFSAALRSEECVLRYSNRRFFGFPYTGKVGRISNLKSASNPLVFGTAVRELMSEVAADTAAAAARFAVGEMGYGDAAVGGSIYGMAWCTQDLSSGDCMQCIQYLLKWLKMEYAGGQVFTVNCAVRFETSPFSNFPQAAPPSKESALAPAGSLAAGPVSGVAAVAATGEDISARTVSIVGIIIAAALAHF